MTDFFAKLNNLTNKEVVKDVSNVKSLRGKIDGYIHSPLVMLIGGLYKGNQGFVKNFYPGKYNVSVKEERYEKYGYNLKVNERILEIIPELYIIKTGDDIMNMPVDVLAHIMIYITIDGILEIGNVINKNALNEYKVKKIILNQDDITKRMTDMTWDDMNTADFIKSGLEKLSKRIMNGEDFGSMIDKKEKNISSVNVVGEYHIVLYSGKEGERNYIGKYGKLEDIVPSQIKVLTTMSLQLRPNQVSKVSENTLRIKKGQYASDKIYESDYTSPHLEIILNSNGRTLTENVFNIGKSDDPIYIKRAITPNDVFYYDVILSGNRDGQIVKINSNGTFDVDVKVGNGITKMTNVLFSEIEYLQNGFMWKYSSGNNVKIDIEEVPRFLNDDENIAEETDEIKEEEEYQGYSDEPEELVLEDNVEMKETFNDKDRLSYDVLELTKKQNSLRLEIVKILKVLCINDEYINVYNLSILSEDVLNKLVKMSNKKDIMLNTIDIKYIISILVLFELVRQGVRQNNEYGLSDYINRLSNGKCNKDKTYLKNSDIFNGGNLDSTILLNKDLLKITNIKSQIKQLREYYNADNYSKIVNILMSNAFIILKDLLKEQIIMEPASVNFINLIPLGTPSKGELYLNNEYSYNVDKKSSDGKMYKQKITIQNMGRNSDRYEREDKKFITITELDNLPNKEVPINWGKNGEKILKDFKVKLMSSIKDNDPLRDDYLYAIENIERTPFVLRGLEKLQKKHKFLKNIYQQFLERINVLKKEKQSEVDNIINIKNIEYKEIMKNRKRIMPDISEDSEEERDDKKMKM